jgi:hypothetical protein
VEPAWLALAYAQDRAVPVITGVSVKDAEMLLAARREENGGAVPRVEEAVPP